MFSISDLVLVFIKNIYDARKTAFHLISLHLEFSRTEKKKKAMRRRRITFSSPFSEFGKPVKRSLCDTSLQNFSWCSREIAYVLLPLKNVFKIPELATTLVKQNIELSN